MYGAILQSENAETDPGPKLTGKIVQFNLSEQFLVRKVSENGTFVLKKVNLATQAIAINPAGACTTTEKHEMDSPSSLEL